METMRSKYVRYFLWILVVYLSSHAGASQQRKSDVPESQPSAVPKTRTELLNELSLKAAQVDLEHAQEAFERYKREYENAQRLYDNQIMSKKELDEALSAYTRAQQQLKQAQIQLERTKLSFLDNATHITIMEAKKYYDNYELTPSYSFEVDDKGKVKVNEGPFTVPDDNGVESYSLLSAPVVVSLIKQLKEVLMVE